ncbi:MAG: hypothetical protein ACTSUE_20425 [Promethearchaeota archaeon]
MTYKVLSFFKLRELARWRVVSKAFQAMIFNTDVHERVQYIHERHGKYKLKAVHCTCDGNELNDKYLDGIKDGTITNLPKRMKEIRVRITWDCRRRLQNLGVFKNIQKLEVRFSRISPTTFKKNDPVLISILSTKLRCERIGLDLRKGPIRYKVIPCFGSEIAKAVRATGAKTYDLSGNWGIGRDKEYRSAMTAFVQALDVSKVVFKHAPLYYPELAKAIGENTHFTDVEISDRYVTFKDKSCMKNIEWTFSASKSIKRARVSGDVTVLKALVRGLQKNTSNIMEEMKLRFFHSDYTQLPSKPFKLLTEHLEKLPNLKKLHLSLHGKYFMNPVIIKRLKKAIVKCPKLMKITVVRRALNVEKQFLVLTNPICGNKNGGWKEVVVTDEDVPALKRRKLF